MRVMLFRKKRVYLDYAAATPVDTEVLDVFLKTQQKAFANPGGLHAESVTAKQTLEEARLSIAKTISALPDEIIFVSGGTESDNLALRGVLEAIPKNHFGIGVLPHVVISAIEHSALFETVSLLEKRGMLTYTLLPVDSSGRVDIKTLKSLLCPQTVFVSIMYVNNEIGTIQPIRDIAKELRHFKKTIGSAHYPVFHVDAAQAPNYLPISVSSLGVDLLSLSASKIYAPRGIALLYRKRGVPLVPIFGGGGQEGGMRPGTESVALAVACAFALKKAQAVATQEAHRVGMLVDLCENLLRQRFQNIVIYGEKEYRAPHILNFHIPGVSAEIALLYLDAKGYALSSKSACTVTDPEESHVIAALNIPVGSSEEGSLRVSFGRNTKAKDITGFVSTLESVLGNVRGEV